MVVANKKIWRMKEIDESLRSQVAGEASCSHQVSALLLSRGIKDSEQARQFLHPRLMQLLDPEMLPDINKAAERINKAIGSDEKICIFGDYDVDGISSTCLLLNFFKLVEKEVAYRLPNRFKGGYGLNLDMIREFAGDGITLLITVDNGSSSKEEIDLAAELGMDVVVCDHHQPSDDLPTPVAHINPWLSDSDDIFKNLAGVGVTYKLVWALCRHFSKAKKLSAQFRDFMCESLGLAALGTIADVVPLLEENRILAKFGLRELARSKRPGIEKLVDIARQRSGSDGALSTEDVGFGIGPRINAVGRLSDPGYALELLMAEDKAKAEELFDVLENENNKRRKIGTEIFEDVCRRIENEHDPATGKMIVMGDPSWHPGVLGIVASRVVEKYYRPVFLFAITDGIARGSARSIKGVHLFNTLSRCEELFDRVGGHEMAAGGTLQADRIEELRCALNELIELDPAEMIPELEYDCCLELKDINESFLAEISQLEPFGSENSEPLFATMQLEVVGNPKLMGKDGRHISFHVRQREGEPAYRAVAFNMGHLGREITRGTSISLLYHLRTNVWRGTRNIELMVKDLRLDS